MTLPKVTVTRAITKGGMELIKKYAGKKYDLVLFSEELGVVPPKSWILENVKGAEGILCTMSEKISPDVIEAAGPQLKTVSTFSAGYDHIAADTLKEKGISLGSSATALTDAVADIGAMLALMATRRGKELYRTVDEGKWSSMGANPYTLNGKGLQGATIGVLGFGYIGQLTAQRLIGFGIKKIVYTTSKPGKPMTKDHFGITSKYDLPVEVASSLDDLAAQSDLLITTASLSPDTFHVIGKDFISKMKKGSYIVNTGRGPLVDTEALIEALESGHLAGAGLDVLEGEPNIGTDHPLVKHDRAVLLPHIGSATVETRDEMGRQAALNLFAGLGFSDDDGKPFPWATQVL